MTDRELLQSISDIIIGKIGTITDNMTTKEDLSNCCGQAFWCHLWLENICFFASLYSGYAAVLA